MGCWVSGYNRGMRPRLQFALAWSNGLATADADLAGRMRKKQTDFEKAVRAVTLVLRALNDRQRDSDDDIARPDPTTQKRKHLLAILAAVLFAIATAGYSLSNLDHFHPPNLPIAAKLGFIICWSAGAACGFLWTVFGFLARSYRKPGVSWLRANYVFDFPFPSLFYTDEGIRTLRIARHCLLLWLLLWAIGVAIAFPASRLPWVLGILWLLAMLAEIAFEVVGCLCGVACLLLWLWAYLARSLDRPPLFLRAYADNLLGRAKKCLLAWLILWAAAGAITAARSRWLPTFPAFNVEAQRN